MMYVVDRTDTDIFITNKFDETLFYRFDPSIEITVTRIDQDGFLCFCGPMLPTKASDTELIRVAVSEVCR